MKFGHFYITNSHLEKKFMQKIKILKFVQSVRHEKAIDPLRVDRNFRVKNEIRERPVGYLL